MTVLVSEIAMTAFARNAENAREKLVEKFSKKHGEAADAVVDKYIQGLIRNNSELDSEDAASTDEN